MSTKRFIFIMACLASLLGVEACSDSEQVVYTTSKERVLVVYDNQKKEAMPHHPITLWETGLGEKTTSPRNIATDATGKIHLSLRTGKYKVETAYIKGAEIDNFIQFEVNDTDTGEIVIPLEDMRPYYDSRLTVVGRSSQLPRANEPVLLITLDASSEETESRELVTDQEGTIHFRVVAGLYRAKFAYTPGAEYDNTFDFEVKADEPNEFVMEVKTNLLDDRQSIGHIYFQDNFSWIDSSFPNIEDYMAAPNTKETLIGSVTDPALIAKIEASGWEFYQYVYLRPGYLKYGTASTTRDSQGRITSPPMPIAEGKYSNVKISFDAARYITQSGAKDTSNRIILRLYGSGSFLRNEEVKTIDLFATNTTYNQWIPLEAIAYDISSDTRIAIESTPEIEKSRFFLDNVKVEKESRSEKE